ncbi:hypothetical protein D3C73_1574480 [compost metagenome]
MVLGKRSEDFLDPINLTLSFVNVLLQHGGHFGIVLNSLHLRLHDRQGLVFHGVSVSQASHKNFAGLIIRH